VSDARKLGRSANQAAQSVGLNERRVAKCFAAPEAGPRLLFFTGGTALRETSRHLKAFTHNSIHITTPFDSGGSSAELRRCFRMLGVGDLRNRMMALADESELGSPEIFALFSHRLPTDLDPIELRATLRALLDAPSGLLGVVPAPLRTIVRDHFNEFVRQMPEDFDLRGASMGNLLLAGTYLSSSRDIDAVVLLFERLVLVRGLVLPVVDADLELAAELDDGTILLGQHLLTGKEVPPLSRPITRLWLALSLDDHSRAEISASNRVIKLIEGAELICFPMGSFFSSLIATLYRLEWALPLLEHPVLRSSSQAPELIPNALVTRLAVAWRFCCVCFEKMRGLSKPRRS
jgi:CofD-related protein of GAK system